MSGRETTEDGDASVRVTADQRDATVQPYLLGKFCEHLGRNVDNGMSAQILLNPAFGPWEFPANDRHPDGGIRPEHDAERLRLSIREYCDQWDHPDPETLAEAYQHGCAFGWYPTGDTRTTPDTSPERDRAQRVTADGEGGLRQDVYLPLHRTTEYEFEVRLRASEETAVEIRIADRDDERALAQARVTADREWATESVGLALPDRVAGSDEPYALSLVPADPVDLVVDRARLFPDDHVRGFDPEVVEYLRGADLPLLRWPGGNFVSGYDWRDGIGPLDERPTAVNPAWGRAESNFFGTAEFVEFCEVVGCDPMICVNAGDGTPAEAAQWVEYCNGDPEETEMGRLRAEHGSEEPFGIEYWEIGNELWGQWQVRWTNPEGNADRYRRFRAAMRAVDSSIKVQACGRRMSPENRWDDVLLERAGDEVRSITDHLLTGGVVDAETDPHELFHAFMGYARQLGGEYRDLRERMREAGVEDPRVAVTELQAFAHFDENPAVDHHGAGLTRESLITSKTAAEALYATTIVAECARLGGFVELLTHSATVNHGGGLRKKRQRTWPAPVHHAHALLAPLAGATLLDVECEAETLGIEHSFGDIRAFDGLPEVDALAARGEGAVHVVLVNRRSGDGPKDVSLSLDSGPIADEAEATLTTLAAEHMAAENTYEHRDRVSPTTEERVVADGEIALTLPEYGLVRLTVPHEA